ncbi:MAG: ParA family protein [Gemmataceae bacterium]|nr:ParA family protein [Gemmataceae bacterium]
MRLGRTHIIALTNQKGGCGKTTSTVSLAAACARMGYKVTVVDTDPQCNATDTFGLDREKLAEEGKFTVADAILAKRPARDIEFDFGDRFDGNLFVVPGHKGLGTISQRLEGQLQNAIADGKYSDLDIDDLKNEHRQRLRKSLESLRGERDIIFIDTPPDLGFLMTTALLAADWFVIPVFPSGYDLKGLESLTRNVQKVQQRFNPRLQLLGVLLGNTDARAKLDFDIYGMLTQSFGKDRVFRSVVNRSVKHREATVYGHTIFEHAAEQPAAEQFLAVAKEIVERLEKAESGKGTETSAPPEDAAHNEVAEVEALKEANSGGF